MRAWWMVMLVLAAVGPARAQNAAPEPEAGGGRFRRDLRARGRDGIGSRRLLELHA